MYSFRLYIALVIFIISCGKQITSIENSQDIEIESAYIDYSFDQSSNSARIIAQLDFSSNTSLGSINNVWFEIEAFENVELTDVLYDDGTNGDIIAGNGSYNLDKISDQIVLSNNIYNVSFYVSTIDDDLYKLEKNLAIGEFPTTISNICMPEIYTIPVSEPDSFLVYVSINDPNGSDDIESVVLQKKKLDGYEVGSDNSNGSCSWNSSVDEDFSDVVDLIYVPGYIQDDDCSELIQEETSLTFLYVTGLQIDSLEECGPHGPISFRYKITPVGEDSFYSEEYLMLICHPGECE